MSALQKWIAGAIVSAIVLAVGITVANDSSNAGSTAATPTTIVSGSYASVADLLADSSVALGASCIEIIQSEYLIQVNGVSIFDFNVKALLPVGEGGRVSSDSISTAMVSSDKVAALSEVMTEICVDPLFGGHVAHYFASATINGVRVVDLIPELAPWVGDAGALINTKALEYMPLYDVTLELRPDCVVSEAEDCFTDASKALVQQAIAKHVEWQAIAARLNTILTRFVNQGVQSRASVLNYHLAGGGLFGAGTLPQVVLNDQQEGLPALILEIWLKGVDCPVHVIGFNTQDTRLEEFAPDCTNPQPPPTVVPGTTPGTNPPSHSVPPTATTLPSGTTVPPTTVTTVPPVTTLPPGSTVPPTTVPPTTVPPTVPPTTLKPKDPSKDVNVNPSVPPQVRGPGTTPIGVSPGPATPVFDTPTGCNGPCPTVPRTTTPPPPPAPTTPATTSPVVPTTVVNSGDGQVGVTIPAGPPPSCPVDICG